MPKTYSFRAQLAIGRRAESALAAVMRRAGWQVRTADRNHQRQGIDLFAVSPVGEKVSIEVKTDFRAHHTRNAFVELRSVDVRGQAGWALRSKSRRAAVLRPRNGAPVLLPYRLSALKAFGLARLPAQ